MQHDRRITGTTSVPIRQHAGGYAAEGPGFYIWDEDAGEVLRAARELEHGNSNVSPTARLLVIRDDFNRVSET